MTTSNIYSALVEFRKTYQQPEKNKKVKVTTSKGSYDFWYADMPEVLATLEKPLADNGLSFYQTIDGEQLQTVVTHTSGETITSSFPVDFSPKTVKDKDGSFFEQPLTTQERGAIVTYARRYSLCAAFGIAAEDDNDGNKAEDAHVEHVLNEATASVKATLEQAQSLPNLSKFLADFVTDNLEKIAKHGNQTYSPKQQEIIAQLQKLNGAAGGEPEKKPSKAEVRRIYSALLAEAKAAQSLSEAAEADRKWLDEVKPMMESVLDAEIVADTERQIKGIINDKAAEFNK